MGRHNSSNMTEQEKIRENIKAQREAMLEQKRIDARRESLDTARRIYAANRKTDIVKSPDDILIDAGKIYDWLIAEMKE